MCRLHKHISDKLAKHLGLIWRFSLMETRGKSARWLGFVWLSAICRNVYSSAAERGKERRECASQCRLLTASLKMHPVSVWVPKVTNRNSGEIWPKEFSWVGVIEIHLHLSGGEIFRSKQKSDRIISEPTAVTTTDMTSTFRMVIKFVRSLCFAGVHF